MLIRERLGMAASAIALVAMAAPAGAQQWRGPDRHRHHDHDDGGAVVGALIAGGIIGALLGAASKKKSETVIVDAPPPPPPPAEGVAREPAPPSAFDDIYDEESATDRCASAAEEEGSHYARIAQVDRVTSTEWNGTSWVVMGNLRLTDSLRSASRTSRDFRCTLKPGAAPKVAISDVRA